MIMFLSRLGRQSVCAGIVCRRATTAVTPEEKDACPPLVNEVQAEMPQLPPLPTPRELLKIYKIHALRRLSQNFLLDKRLTNKIVTTTGKIKDCYVCEVGPGTGSITRPILLNGAREVTVIEKDSRLMPCLQMLAECTNGRLKIIYGDVMDLTLEHVFPKELAHEWTMPPPPFFIIGNLPFNVSTPLIIHWLRHCSKRTGPFTHGRTRLTLTFQKEVGDRMVARPGSDVRCRLSVMCQYLCDVESLFTIPGRAFLPKPEVDVSVVKFTPLIKPLIQQPFALVEKVARTLFQHRQKYMRYGIELLFPTDRQELADRVLSESKVNPERRAFELEMEEMRSICDAYSAVCAEDESILSYNFRAGKKTKRSIMQVTENSGVSGDDDYAIDDWN